MQTPAPLRARLTALAFAIAAAGPLGAEPVPWHQQIIERLKTDDAVLPWMPPGVWKPDTMSNREAPIPPQCYTDTGGRHNPCYVCHQDPLPGRENTMGDFDLQEAYAFSEVGLSNHWSNLFEDRSARVAAISDEAIRRYIAEDNYSELPRRLRAAGFSGWIPDLADLEKAGRAFDGEGFARDGSWWVAFRYKPLPSTFWPTQGSTDDVMIRLPRAFYTRTDGTTSREVYKANLAILEGNIKGFGRIGSLPVDEQAVGEDLDGDGLLGTVHEVIAARDAYVGAAATIARVPSLYPVGTEFLHTVRYVGVRANGEVYVPRRMKEVRYMKRAVQTALFQLEHYYEEENLEKAAGGLPAWLDRGHEGLSTEFGWNVVGFIEGHNGRLRFNTYEENAFCMGCHTTIGATIDKTFSFPRKVDGAAGWGYIDLAAMSDAPTLGESRGEIGTYLRRVGGGTEFRSNPELEARFFLLDGSVDTVALASARNLAEIISPSRERALQLNKAYKVLVEDQDFVFGRDATVTPPPRVLASVDNETSPTLPPGRQYHWNILLDWAAVAASECRHFGNVDFRPLTVPATLRADAGGPALCATGNITLGGRLRIALKAAYQPAVGDYIELVRAGRELKGEFANVKLPEVAGLDFVLERGERSLGLRVMAGG